MNRVLKPITFPNWFIGFSRDLEELLGVRVTIRDSNAIMYRNLYDRGHSPQRAAKLMSIR